MKNRRSARIKGQSPPSEEEAARMKMDDLLLEDAIAQVKEEEEEAKKKKPTKTQRKNAKNREKKKAAKAAKGETMSVPIPKELFLFAMGVKASGSLNGAFEHWVDNSDGSMFVGIDGKLTEKGREWLQSIQEGYGGLDKWRETYHVEGDESLMEDLMPDIFLSAVKPEMFVKGGTFDFKKDLFDPLVELQTDKEDPLMVLFFENGKSCSSGGYVDRTETMLANKIPFFKGYFARMRELVEITSVFTRASEEGNHKRHSDDFRGKADIRLLLTVNSNGDESYWSVGIGSVIPHCVALAIFDCTNDEESSRYHADWLRAGIDVITANNRGLSGPKDQREDIKEAEKFNKQSGVYSIETVVAGGLPIISTLRSLLHSGDKIRRIDGIFTVVKSYVMFRISPPPNVANCSQFDVETSNGVFEGHMNTSSSACIGEACSFSQAVREAIQLGLTEDDPALDLKNEYAARVLMALARELGMDKDNETHQIQKDSDVLADFDNSFDFLNLPPHIDEQVQKRVDAATDKGCVLRSIASIDVKSKSIQIRILEVPNHHTFAISPPGCSCVRFFTRRHERYPLIIQGPSAGADSTASALLAELLQRTRGISTPRSLALIRRGSSGAFLHRKHSTSMKLRSFEQMKITT